MDLLEDDFDRKIMKLMDLKKQNGSEHEGCKYFVLPKTNTEFRHRKLNGTESAKIRKDTSCKIQTSRIYYISNFKVVKK